MQGPVSRRVVAAVAAVLLLAGCTGGASNEAGDPGGPSDKAGGHAEKAGGPEGPGAGPAAPAGAPSYQRYVALGDSFTAAPYVPATDLAQGCLRSDGNYPALVADRLDVADLVDVSCSGADTGDLVRPQNTFRDATVPPQLDALTSDTDLVTLGIGGNDFDLFGTLLQTCIRLRAGDPDGSPCADYLDSRGTDLGRQITRVGSRVARSVERIRRRAPRAEILLVGYPRLVPGQGTCPRLLPLARDDYAFAGRVGRMLDRALRRAAGSSNVGFVEMYDASRGHDVCSDAPWVNGRFTDQARALAFHPFAAEMDAVAERVVDRLG